MYMFQKDFNNGKSALEILIKGYYFYNIKNMKEGQQDRQKSAKPS